MGNMEFSVGHYAWELESSSLMILLGDSEEGKAQSLLTIQSWVGPIRVELAPNPTLLTGNRRSDNSAMTFKIASFSIAGSIHRVTPGRQTGRSAELLGIPLPIPEMNVIHPGRRLEIAATLDMMTALGKLGSIDASDPAKFLGRG